jgi:hypothetical protein
MTYVKFRTNLKGDPRGIDRRIVSSLPVTWLEDIPLEEEGGGKDDEEDDGGDRREAKKKKKKKARSLSSLLSDRRREAVRNFRGTGLALLVADPLCEASILEQYRHRDLARFAKMRSATLFEDGAARLTHCAVTGLDRIVGEDGSSTFETSYFLRFDDAGPGARRQRRPGGGGHHLLPPNLVERLLREGRDRASIRYLSTGASYSSGVFFRGGGGGHHRCYYAEFNDGECWWGTNGDDVLDRIFTRMDVHRVAFGGGGGESSWIAIGKNGSVKWRNVPRGLHDFLIALDSMAESPVSPCEVSLGMDGTYFVRLLDGSIDYSLPNFVAEVIDELEADGKIIRNVSLHVDTSDCLIRYSIDGERV